MRESVDHVRGQWVNLNFLYLQHGLLSGPVADRQEEIFRIIQAEYEVLAARFRRTDTRFTALSAIIHPG